MLETLKMFIKSRKLSYFEFTQWRKTYTGTSILKLAHSLEKGMGLPEIKQGFGINKADLLCCKLETYRDNERSKSDFDYLEALHILESYINFQQSKNVDIENLQKRVNILLTNLSANLLKKYNDINAGYEKYRPFSDEVNFDFYSYLKNRHSVRDFDIKQSVNPEDFYKAVKFASMAPSACNRQPCKIYYTLNHEKSRIVGEIVPGNKGFEENIPYYAIITVDRSAFDLPEVYQWFVNGGIFLAYFIIGLYVQEIGSCILQFPFNELERSKKMHEVIGADEHESICAVVAFGKCKKECKYIYAQRKDVEELIKDF